MKKVFNKKEQPTNAWVELFHNGMEPLKIKPEQSRGIGGESGSFTSELFNTISDFVTVQDVDYNVVWINDTAVKAFSSKVIGRKCYQAYHGRNNVCPDCNMRKSIINEEATVSYFIQRGKPENMLELWSVPLKNETGNIIAVIEQAVYVSERKKLENIIRESEEKFRTLVNNVRLGILRSTPEPAGRFLELNRAMTEITGYSREELLDINVSDLYVYPEDRVTLLSEVASTDRKITKEIRIRKKDGTEIICSDTKFPVRDSNGKITHFDGILEDITERKRVEEERRKSLEDLSNLSAYLGRVREEERSRLARVIHDELGQSLTALKMDLAWMNRRIPPNMESLLEKIKTMSNIVDTTVQMVKRLSTQLRPQVLDDLGLIAAIEWQVAEFQERTGIKCESSVLLQDISIDKRQATSVFRIFQEALTNISRHSEATIVNIDLRVEADRLVLEVEDNGKGISEEAVSSSKSFGLMGIRERVKYWRGDVKIYGVRGKGTSIMVSMPLNPEKVRDDKNIYR